MPHPNQHVVVIGGSRGLGFEIAKANAAAGAQVTITGRDPAVAAARAKEIGDNAIGAGCQLTDPESVAALFDGIDHVDHLVLAALDRDHNTIAEFRPHDCTNTMMMKTVGYASAAASAAPKLDPAGSIVLFSGLSMLRPVPGSTTISMANAAIIGLVNTLTIELAPVRVNAVTPGIVAGTDAVDQADPVRAQWYEAMRERTPAKRLPSPDDIVAAVTLLQDCRGINGTNLLVDAGMHLA
jgi:NAD(P)-dependent dehydrogenase (short-subunit alcohol dehydrogenase family)